MESREKISDRVKRSLTTRLLAFIVLFVLVAETVVLVPSIASFRQDWLGMRVESGYLVGLALDSPRGEMIGPEEAAELFATAGVSGVSVNRGGAQYLILAPQVDPVRAQIRHYVDLDAGVGADFFIAPWEALFSKGDDLIRVSGSPRYASAGVVDLIVSEAALRRELWVFTRNVFLLSLIISSITALMMFAALDRLIVAPVKRLTRNMMAFEANPEDPENLLAPSGRADEIGVAEESLAALERRTQKLLTERRRLAALGAGISKISHDLRNILASAQLMSDRLAKSDDPRVRKLAPRLISSLDRAIALSRDTLSYARMEPATLKKSTVDLHALVEEVFEDAAAMHVAFVNATPEEMTIHADQTQLYRALFNIVRNAVDALAPPDADGDTEPAQETALQGKVSIIAREIDGMCAIDISDNGPGIPEKARELLFEPFKGSMKPGGSGLGVAIAHEIARAHNGVLTLADTSPQGTTFRLALPIGEA